jgi:hypothetical protein
LIKHADLKTRDGHRRVVRHGRQREIMTDIGPVAVRQPCMRDQETGAGDPERIRFTPAILPPYARRSKSLEMLIPILYLKGVSTGDFVRLSLFVSLSAVGIAAFIGMPLGAFLALVHFPGRTFFVVVINAFMGLPPVLAGLAVFLLLSRSGPFGFLGILFTPRAMIVAQTLQSRRRHRPRNSSQRYKPASAG